MYTEIPGSSINTDFEMFLHKRTDDMHWNLQKWSEKERKFIGDFDIERELENVGVDGNVANNLYNLIMVGIGEIQEQVYIQGVKDGFNLALHIQAEVR